MRVLLMVDMEGVSQIVDHRECWPTFPEYWQTGQTKYTADVTAAALGLFDGGASRIVIADSHGSGYWKNILVRDLPERVEMILGRPSYGSFDAAFQVGLHARCGTVDGFMSHTHVPNFRMAVDGALITESHDDVWTAGLPLLGITGDAALHRELDGSLSGTPFLAVKHSTSRVDTTPAYGDPGASSEAIREFARQCARDWRDREVPSLASRFTVEVSLDPDLVRFIKPDSGLTRVSDAVAMVEGSDWRHDAKPALKAAKSAALRPWFQALDRLDLSTEEAMLRQDPEKLERMRRYIACWMHAQDEPWLV